MSTDHRTHDDRGYLTAAAYRTLKSRLTRARNSGDPARVLAECRRAVEVFDRGPWPDDWARWDVAARDAEYELARRDAGLGIGPGWEPTTERGKRDRARS